MRVDDVYLIEQQHCIATFLSSSIVDCILCIVYFISYFMYCTISYLCIVLYRILFIVLYIVFYVSYYIVFYVSYYIIFYVSYYIIFHISYILCMIHCIVNCIVLHTTYCFDRAAVQFSLVRTNEKWFSDAIAHTQLATFATKVQMILYNWQHICYKSTNDSI